jgi:putative ABC transport system substrate-binding protein
MTAASRLIQTLGAIFHRYPIPPQPRDYQYRIAMIKRRPLLLLAASKGVLLSTPPAFAQNPRPRSIAVISAGRLPPLETYTAEMRNLGYIEGKSIKTDFYFYGAGEERLETAAKELVKTNPDVVLAVTNIMALAVRKYSKSVPMVVAASHDGVRAGLFASLAKPGGNTTGGESLAPELEAKRLELARELYPRAVEVSVIHDPEDAGSASHMRVIQELSPRIGLSVRSVPFSDITQLDSQLKENRSKNSGAAIVVSSPRTFNARVEISALAIKHRIGLICEFSQFPDSGALLSIGPEFSVFFARAAHLTDRILRGANPGDLPVEQISSYPMILNRRTASLLGISVPQSILVRVDRFIDK